MDEKTESQNEPPQTYRAAVQYVMDYLLQHPPTYELEFRDPPGPNHLLDAVMLLREWLHEATKAAHGSMPKEHCGEGRSI